jgi:hypothetical protein
LDVEQAGDEEEVVVMGDEVLMQLRQAMVPLASQSGM